MKTYRGCVNPECDSYKKKRKYKENDKLCAECGEQLHYVCSKCWKPLGEKKKYCIICKAEIDQKNAIRMEAVKDAGKKAAAVVPVFVSGVTYLANNTETVAKGVKKTADAVKIVRKVIKK